MNLEIMSSAKMSLIKLGCLVDYENRSEIELTVLVPNGLTINMSVSPEIKLSEIKEDVFEIAQDLPLFGALHDLHVYTFTCINLTTSEQEELDEDRRLSDVKPFLQILRLVEREGDMASKQLNAQIGLLIGKGLHEFDALKNSEINDFRWRARLHSEEIQEERYKGSWIEKVNYKHPLRVEESTELPCYLKNILTSEEIEIELQFENFELFCRLSQQLNQDNQNGSFDCFDSQVAKLFQNSQTTRLSYLTCVDEIVLMAIKLFNCDQSDPDQLMLKVCGKDEYLLGSHPLMQYKYIRECIANYRTPSLIVVSKDSISVESKISVKNQEEFRFRSSTGHGYSTTRRRSNPISSMCLTEKYGFTVCEALKINHCDDVQLAIQVGLYHGGQPLTHSISTPNQIIENGQCVWNETLTLDIAVGDIPRMARLCFVIYQVIIRARKGSRGKFFRSNINCEITMNPLRWANTSVFDYKGQLRTGSLTLPMWNYPDGYEQEDMLNPLGTVMPNPNTDETTCLTITFKKYNQSENHLIVYPHLDTILSMESISIPVESSRNGHRSRAGSITSTMSTSSTDHRLSSRNLDMIREICCRDPLTPMVSKDREFLWYFRDDCCQYFPSSLPHLIACVKWNDRREVIELIKMLHQWPIIEPRKALELLDYAYADCHVRTYAIKCLKSLSDEDLSLYLLQLVQALKNESYLYCDLALFLLERALKNRNIGHHFFWLLRSEMSEPSISTYFGLILEAYCRGAIEHMKDLVKQVDANNYLKHMNEIVKREFINKTRDSKDRLAVTMQEILDLDYYKEYFQDFINPLNPSVKLKNIRTDRCRLMDSKMKPLWLVFSNEDARAEDVSIIFKSGDDLRQDMLTVQMIRIMDKLWKDEGLDLRMEPYGVIATEKQVGLIEVVTNTQTLARIQKSHSMRATSAFNKASLLNWLKCNNPDQESLSKAINQFTLSCAGYCVATYVLGVADRHSDNILVKTNGQILHIDFGHILGKFKEKFGIRRERVPFVLTNDFVYVITAGNTQNGNFHEFQNYCEQAFTILRKKGSFILSLFAMMLSSGIPELSSIEDLDYLRETLVLDLNDEEALKHFRCKFEEALKNSWKTSINMMAHNISRTNKNQ